MTDERGSDRHGPRTDDALDEETESLTRGYPVESRADEARTQEAPDDTEPEPDSRILGDRGLTADGLTPDEVNERSDLARFLPPEVFPADRRRLLREASERSAPAHVVARVQAAPPDRVFAHVHDLWVAAGGREERRD